MSEAKRLWDKGQELNHMVHAFTVGRDYILDQKLAAFDAVASAAHARMLERIGVLEPAELQDLLAGLRAIFQKSREGSFIVAPEQEDCHTAIEFELCEQLGTAGKKIHTGRSRNDQVLVALRLYQRESLLEQLIAVQDLLETLSRKAAQGVGKALPGYTHMQRAMPTTVATHLLSYAQYALSLLADGLGLFEQINWNPLGVGSGFGVPLELDREYTSELLGFAQTQANPIFVQSTRGREELKLLNWLTDVQALVEKAAADLMLFSTEEYGLVKIPLAFTTGSSIMPQKRNPDVLELLRAQASRMRGMRTELEGLLCKLPSSYHRDFQYTKEPVFRAFEESLKALKVFALVIEGLEFDEQAALRSFGPGIFSTDYAYSLLEQGLPFREAYLQAARDLAEGKINLEVLKDDFLKREVKRTEAELQSLIQQMKDIRAALEEKQSLIELVNKNIFKSE